MCERTRLARESSMGLCAELYGTGNVSGRKPPPVPLPYRRMGRAPRSETFCCQMAAMGPRLLLDRRIRPAAAACMYV